MSLNRVVLKDKENNHYSFNYDNPYIVATNPIYIAEENPDIYIKVLKHPSLLEYPRESEYIKTRVKNELDTAKTLSDSMFPVPHVYYTKIDLDNEFITGYIVMDKIKGRTISGIREFNRYFDKIYEVLKDLLEFGLIYSDMNINNFIVGEDDEVYLIDFEDTIIANNINTVSELVEILPTGGISLNKEYIKEHLKRSVKIRKKYRMDNSASSSLSSSPESSSQRKTHKKSKSPNSSPSTPRKTQKQSNSKSPKSFH